MPVITFLILSTFGVSTTEVEAGSVSWNKVFQGSFKAFTSGHYSNLLKDTDITVRYNARITNDLGEVINSGKTVPVGSNIKLEFLPHVSNDIYWFGTGHAFDSPYGEWTTNVETGAPSISCKVKDWVIKIGNSYNTTLYFPISFSP